MDKLLAMSQIDLDKLLTEKRSAETKILDDFRKQMAEVSKSSKKEDEDSQAASAFNKRRVEARRAYSDSVKKNGEEMRAKQAERRDLAKTLKGKELADATQKWHEDVRVMHKKHGEVIQGH